MAEGHYWRIIIHLCLCFWLSENMHISLPFLLSGNRGRRDWAVISGWQLPFCLAFYPVGHRSIWYQNDNISWYWKTSRASDQAPSPLSDLSPSRDLVSQTLASTEATGRTFVWHCKLQGDVSSRFTLWCEWKKQSSIHIVEPKRPCPIVSEFWMMMLHSEKSLFTRLCEKLAEETHIKNSFDPQFHCDKRKLDSFDTCIMFTH